MSGLGSFKKGNIGIGTMQHLKKGRVFGRTKNLRSALIRDLVKSLIEHEKITTTEAKAKSLRPAVEKIITRGKKRTLAVNRHLVSFFGEKTAKKVSGILAPRYQSRFGGYTRITKLPPRKSDGSRMAVIELVK